MNKIWKIQTKIPAPGAKETSAPGAEIREQIIKALLKNRGFKSEKEAREFLNPADPYGIKPESIAIKRAQIKKAIKRIKKAIKNKEQIIIYGDYDADGITATAVLWETLHKLGAKALPFIPSRDKHGYGLSKKGIDDILNLHQSPHPEDDQPLAEDTNHQTLLITVDNGIVAHDAVDYANKKEIDVIITDHHQPLKSHSSKVAQSDSSDGVTKFPDAVAIVHSTDTSGAGVAWFLAKEIYSSFKKTMRGFKASNSLELATIGTITDIMPMRGVNRSLVKFGMEELRKSNRIGIKSLCKEISLIQKDIDVYHIGYIIGPRINAMGRLADALDSLRFLCTNNKKRAGRLALKLNKTNRQRQQLTEETYKHALKGAKKQAKKEKILVVAHESYNQGIIGLVAGRLQEKFSRPAVVMSVEGEFAKGSARSIKGFNIVKALRKFKNIFKDIGGHPMAAGFTIETKKIDELKKKLQEFASKEIKKEQLVPVIEADLEIGLDNVNWKLYRKLEKFSPFGLDNKRPRFVSRGVEVLGCRAVGRESKHLKLKIAKGKTLNKTTSKVIHHKKYNKGSSLEVRAFNAIAFNLGNLSSKISQGDKIDILYTIFENNWNGNKSLELKVRDIKVLQKDV